MQIAASRVAWPMYRAKGSWRRGVVLGIAFLLGAPLDASSVPLAAADVAQAPAPSNPADCVAAPTRGCTLAAALASANAITDADRKSTRLNSSHIQKSRMPSSA